MNADPKASTPLERLRAGNARFANGQPMHEKSSAEQIASLPDARAPFALLLTCSNPSVSPEVIFDQEIGDLFVVRVAGNIIDDAVLGTVEYAVGELGVRLVVVLGHAGCNAVRAAMADVDENTHLDELVRSIGPAIKDAHGDLEGAIRLNAQNVAATMRGHGLVLGPAIASDDLAIVPAHFDHETKSVEFLETRRAPPRGSDTLPPMSAVPHRLLHEARVFLDVDAESLEGLVFEVLERLHELDVLSNEKERRIRHRLEQAGPFAVADDLGHGVGVIRVPATEVGNSRVVLVNCSADRFEAEIGTPLSFLWIVIGPNGASLPTDDELEPFGWMLVDDRFIGRALEALSRGELVDAYEEYLAFVEAPAEPEAPPPELERTGRFLGGLINDVKRRLPHYGSDFTDGLNAKTVASVLFLFFACFAPAVAFGGLLSVLTEGSIGAVEMIVATFICGTIYALTSGQPLTILGSTGPVIVFMGIVYELCVSLNVPYFPALACIGLWTALILVVLAVTEASYLIRYFTRFTDETFAALIAIIFVVEALRDTFKGFTTPEIPYDTALLSLVLALGTYVVATQLSRIRRSPYLLRPYREFLADFGPAIAILAMTGIAIWLHPVRLEVLAVPETFAPTADRGWLVSPLDAPRWVWGASIVPAILVAVLLFLDQNITVRLVNDSRHKLNKGSGYHLDLLVLGILVGVCSILGLPWMVAATVRSLNHVRALAKTETHGGDERIVSVSEQRLSALLVHLLIGASLLFLTLLATVPMSVLFGLFLYMGIASARGNQFFERLRLWIMDPSHYPPTHFLRRVPTSVVHKFTAVQAACLVLLWVVKTSILGILFPLFIALLVPIRFGLERFIDKKHLAFLDAEEAPSEEEERALD